MYKKYFKPFFDFVIALFGLIILSPVFLICSLLLLIANKSGGVFFLQQRPGKNEKIFQIIKFKTMNDKKDVHGDLLPDSQRLTTLGKVMRKTSLDEIPQLINVIKGDMSLIGPRPLLVRYLPYYTDRERLRHSIKPGITGYAQVKGRNTINWDERLKLDVFYAENISLKLDLQILLKTVNQVARRKDIAVIPGELFMPLDKYRNDETKS